MKREDVIAGGEYATDLGEHVKIADEQPGEDGVVPSMASTGWRIEDGDWVQSEEFGKRLMPGRTYKRYQTNVSLRATNLTTKEKIVIEPRRLTLPWDEHVTSMQKAREDREALEANAAALTSRASRLDIKVHPDLRRQEVRLSFQDVDTLLRKAKV